MYIYVCPKCNISLEKSSGLFGVFWLCPNCSGKAVSLSVLRQSVPVPIVSEFWSRIKSGEFPEKKKCPGCSSLMSEVPIMHGEKAVFLDICKKCNFIWFDAKEYESLPQVEIPKEKLEKLPLKAQEALVKLQLKGIQNQHEFNEMMKIMTPDMRVLFVDSILDLIFSGL